MPKQNHITPRENAILFAFAAGQIATWKEAYILANQKPEDIIAKQTALNCSVTRWKQRVEIQTAYNNAIAILQARDNANQLKGQNQGKGENNETGQEENINGESVRTETPTGSKGRKIVDYSNPAEQTRKLNELVNTATDPGEALDALKVIIASQKADRESAREGKRVVFYTPLKCRDCPLYEKAKQKRVKEL